MKVDQDTTIAPTLSASAPAYIYKPYHQDQIDAISKTFYVKAMNVLNDSGIPFLVGGAYAFSHYSGIDRHTKDFDIFVKKEDADRILAVLQTALNCKVDRKFPHWLYKAILGENFIDIIFSSGNGIAVVDDIWFQKSARGIVLGESALVIPAEEMIWSKGFIMERERYDGADIAHTIRGWGKQMDWERLINRFDGHWRVLYSHLVLFGYIYPSELDSIPSWVMEKLARRTLQQHLSSSPSTSLSSISPSPISSTSPPASSLSASAPCPTTPPLVGYSASSLSNLCQGTLLSRQQYLKDVEEWKYEDARLKKRENGTTVMSTEDVSLWTAAAFIEKKETDLVNEMVEKALTPLY